MNKPEKIITSIEWFLYDSKKPDSQGEYFVTDMGGRPSISHFNGTNFTGITLLPLNIIYWANIPKIQ